MKVMRENPKTFQAAVQYALVEQNFDKRFHLRPNDHEHPQTRTEVTMEIDHIRPQKMFYSIAWGKCGKMLQD